MLDLMGWFGGILLAVCAVPQAWVCWRQGHANGLSWGMIWLWTLGEVFMFAYVLPKQDWPLILNYLANIFVVGIIFRYKAFPRTSRPL